MLTVQREDICGRLRELRVSAGYTQEKLAEILMLSPSTVSKIENGRTPDAEVYVDWIYVCTNEPLRFEVKGG